MVDLASAKTIVKDLVHWENPVSSASTLGFVLSILVSICYFSFISVIAYISLTLLVIVLGIKIYSYAMVFLKKVHLKIHQVGLSHKAWCCSESEEIDFQQF